MNVSSLFSLHYDLVNKSLNIFTIITKYAMSILKFIHIWEYYLLHPTGKFLKIKYLIQNVLISI